MNIAAVSAQTGLTKEVLRKWESRYGFPIPERDPIGNRRFSIDHVSKLQLIKVLLDRGMRPGQVVPLSNIELSELVAAHAPPDRALAPETAEQLIASTLSCDPQAIRSLLASHVDRLGLAVFVCTLLPSMTTHIGHAWSSGRIGIGHEHAYTEAVQSLLRERLDRMHPPAGGPRVLLTTPAGEMHALGLLMAEMSLSLEGAECVALGPNLPADEVVRAAGQYGADIVGLSVSDAFPARALIAFVRGLRRALPPSVVIWVGGAACRHLPRGAAGIVPMPTLDKAIESVRAFRARSPATASLAVRAG